MNTRKKSLNKILIILLFLSFCYVYLSNIGTVSIYVEQSKETKPVGEILSGIEIGQSFYSSANNICGISFKLATYMRLNKGKIQIGIKDMGSNDVVFISDVSTESIKDNEYLDLKFPPIKFSKGKHYYIFIKSLNGTPGNAITAYMNEEDQYKEGDMYLNGTKKTGDLVFKVYYNNTFF
ncbi:hypothetical protein [Paenibacillus elgii]|uniref:hypothetical protein n=1 Tax=Paenibacillus elgii TaxID=189691 RepID=UPI00203F9722|nr:hypothetical protein [Paenibacillus elgii]MCM3272397.1 hypothetical protein [Paenibacillus elgii]